MRELITLLLRIIILFFLAVYFIPPRSNMRGFISWVQKVFLKLSVETHAYPQTRIRSIVSIWQYILQQTVKFRIQPEIRPRTVLRTLWFCEMLHRAQLIERRCQLM